MHWVPPGAPLSGFALSEGPCIQAQIGGAGVKTVALRVQTTHWALIGKSGVGVRKDVWGRLNGGPGNGPQANACHANQMNGKRGMGSD